MARPQKSSSVKRSRIIKIRVTQAERNRLVATAKDSGMTLSDYVRTKTINSMPLIRKATPEREALIRGLAELGKIGSNVNQIARGINRGLAEGNTTEFPNQLIRHSLYCLDTLTSHLIQILERGH